MKVRKTGRRSQEQVTLNMTAMIDIVFQLLVFFVMTFKIVALEGDFNIKMPLGSTREGAVDDHELPPLRLYLTAHGEGDNKGKLKSIRLNERSFGRFEDLHQHIIGLIGDDTGPGSIQESAEVTLICDYHLNYKHVIEAITAVSGYETADKKIVRLVEKIKFKPQDES